jgi:hypothetical protein
MKKAWIAGVIAFLFFGFCLFQAMHVNIKDSDRLAWWQFRPLVTVGVLLGYADIWICDKFNRLGVPVNTPAMSFVFYSVALIELALCSAVVVLLMRSVLGKRRSG